MTRLLFLFSRADAQWPHSVFYEGDAAEWVRWAQALGRGQPYEFNLPLRSPGVAYILYLLGAGDTTLHSYLAWKALWCVMSAATCALAYWGFVMVFPRRVSLIAAGLSVFSFGGYVLATSLNNETPYALCVFAALVLTLRMSLRPTMVLAAMLAFVHAAAMLLRAEHPLFMLALAGWLVWRWRRPLQPAVAAELTDPKRTNRKANPSPVGRSAAKAVAVSWPRIGAMAAVMLGGAATLCLPWSIRGAAAIHRFNTTTSGAIDFAHIRPPNAPADFPAVSWTLDAQEAMKSLPAFVQVSNSNILTSLVAMSGRTVVTLEDVRHLYLEYFHCLPEPVRPWALLSIKGPLDFALANHPDAAGTYSKSALALPGVSNPMINLSNPDHLYLLNHGYSAGWQFISSDYGRWTLNLGRKLAYFSDGMTLGYTAANLPLGPFGQRRSIDLMTPLPDQRVVWRVFLLAIFLAGAIKAIRARLGGLWLLTIAGKILVTLAFYGYARHAASIFPAFALFMALPLDSAVQWTGARLGATARAGWILAGIIVGAALVVDVATFFNPPSASVAGPIV